MIYFFEKLIYIVNFYVVNSRTKSAVSLFSVFMVATFPSHMTCPTLYRLFIAGAFAEITANLLIASPELLVQALTRQLGIA